MKTTIDISGHLLQQAKKQAAREGMTLKALVERGLRKVLAEGQAGNNRPYKMADARFKGGEGLPPDVQGMSWQEILELSYGHRGGDQPR
jgi:hypothetical protein